MATGKKTWIIPDCELPKERRRRVKGTRERNNSKR